VLPRLFERPGREQAAIFRKSDEQHTVEQFLGGFDQRFRFVGIALHQGQKEADAPGLVIAVEFLGDRLLGLRAFAQQCCGGATEQVVGGQEQTEALIGRVRVREFEDVETIVDLTGVADRVEPELQHVGNQQELATRGVHRVFPHLLHRTLVAAGHDGVEVGSVRAFQLDGRNHGLGGVVEMPQRGIGGTAACALLGRDRPSGTTAEGPVTQNLDKETLDERPANLGLLLLAQRATAYGIRPIAQRFLVLRRGGLRECPLAEKTAIEQWDVGRGHGCRGSSVRGVSDAYADSKAVHRGGGVDVADHASQG